MAYERSEAPAHARSKRQVDEDRHLRRVRCRQNHVRRCGVGDHAVAHRGVGDQRVGRAGRARGDAGQDAPRPSRWTSAGSPSTRTSCCICSARRASGGSGSCGTTWFAARSAPSSWWMSVGCRTASRRWTSSRPATCRSSSRSTNSTMRPRHAPHEVRKALALSEHIPIITVDARDRHSSTAALIAVTEYALNVLPSVPG